MNAMDILLGLNELEDDLIPDMQTPERSVPLRRRRTTALLAAAFLVSMLALTAFASSDGTFRLREFFVQRSDPVLSENQLDYIDQYAVPIQQSQTCDGYTLTLDTAISDGIYTYIRIQLTAPEGTILDDQYYGPLERSLTNEDGEKFRSAGNGFDNIDTDPTDNTVTLIYTIYHASWDPGNYDSIFDETWTFRFEGLKAHNNFYSEETGFLFEEKNLSDGIWEFSITFPEQGNGEICFITEPVTCPCQVNLGIQGLHYEDVEITGLNVRALSAVLTFRHPKAEVLNGRFDSIFAVMKDGSMAKLIEATNAPNHLTFQFAAPIVLEDIDHILLPNGTRLYPPGA